MGQKVTGIADSAIISILVGAPAKGETTSHWHLSSNRAGTYLCTAQQITRVQHVRYDRFVNKNRRVLLAGVCWFSMNSVKLSADSVDEEKKSPEKSGNESFGKWSWLTGPSIHGAQQKSRRCSAKESSVLFTRIDGAKRKQSIYSQISINCYASGGSNTGQKHSKIIVFPLGFSWSFLSVAFLSMDSSGATQ